MFIYYAYCMVEGICKSAFKNTIDCSDAAGEKQIAEYLDHLGLDTGYLLSLN